MLAVNKPFRFAIKLPSPQVRARRHDIQAIPQLPAAREREKWPIAGTRRG